ncbi:MAG TPA: hypothetical protein DFR83_09510, partial [Deltaproteobacteria bacterium]|nr:hypothetical protein [Deltaproteobacteria bacterium]
MSLPRLGAAAVPVALLLVAIGWWLSGVWMAQILDTLAHGSVEVVTVDPAVVHQMRAGVAAALGGSPFLAIGVRAAISRLSKRAPTWAEWAMAIFWLFLGSQAGLGGALFATARVSIPAALDASTVAGAVSIDAAELALGNWALAGVAGAAVIVVAVGLVSAGLEASGHTAPSPHD